ncbi:MAG: mechanosensitive ion channel protein MscS [Alphaproteobacteria bacterium CG_4_9_14_3_um_filter_47_13]|nr:MAG: mechanosensitive ion channel protein MscS [Alphaproteobacteria bacterium CG_4_9_14_3_um_filter_47_13]
MEEQIADKLVLVQENLPFYLEMGMRLLSAALIMIAGWITGNWLSTRIQRIKKVDETLTSFLGGLIKYVILAVAGITVLGQFGVQTASLLAVLGGAALAVGLALQGTLSNVAAGTMMLILRPFKVGDYITFAGTGGTVKSLGLFGTELATPDNVYIFAPNSQIWGNDIFNYSRNAHRRQDIKLGISYDDDIGKALKTVQKVLDGEPRILQTTDDKKPVVLTDNMGAYSIDMLARFWCGKDDYWTLRWDMTKAIKEALDKEGITIPFPTQIEIQRPEDSPKKKKAA